MIPASEALEISNTLRELPKNVDTFLEKLVCDTATNGSTSIYIRLDIARWVDDKYDDSVNAIMWISSHLDFVRNKLRELGYTTDLGGEYTLWINWKDI